MIGSTPSVLTATTLVEWLIDPFTQSATMQRALLAGTFAAIACGLVGTWVVLRGMTFIGDALAHGVIPGLAIATVVGFSLTLGAFASAAVMVAGITVVSRRSRLDDDVAIGLLFVGMLALGVLIISRSRSFAGDLTGFLFGGITSVRGSDLWVGAIVALVALAATAIGYRAFIVLAFNAEYARLAGLRPGITHLVLLALVTATVVASFRTVGSLLVFALITAPAAAAFQLVASVRWALVLAVVAAEISVVVGLLVSWHARLAAGAAMAATAVGLFFVALIISEVRRVVRARSGRRAVAAA